MNDFQIKNLINKYRERYDCNPNVEVVVETIPEAIIIKYDIFNGKYDSKNTYYLRDKFGNLFRVIRRDNLTVIFGHEKIKRTNIEELFEIGVNAVRFDDQF